MTTTGAPSRPVNLDEIARRQDRLRQLQDDALRLQREMTLLRARARARRGELAAARSRVQHDLRMRRSILQTGSARAAAALLDAAVRVSGMEPHEIWLQYFALGGDATPEELSSMLSGDLPLYRIDHDRLVVVINERLQDLGGGRPLAFWDGSR